MKTSKAIESEQCLFHNKKRYNYGLQTSNYDAASRNQVEAETSNTFTQTIIILRAVSVENPYN